MQSKPHSISILLVDDQPRNLIALEAVLAGVDCQVVAVNSGRDALRCVLAQDFAVIVLDVHMPDLDGFETARLIREREQSHSTPIVLMTEYDTAGAQALQGYRLGAVDYIYTPVAPDILRSKVTFFVELFRKTVALEQRTAELMTTAAELERARAEAVLRHHALHDGLTGLPNRVLLSERLEREIGASPGETARGALLMLDLGRFNEVNDTLGRQVGDSLLRQIGLRLQSAVLTTDLVARPGGDEFAVLLPDIDTARAVQVAEDLVRIMQAPFMLDGQSIIVDASIGIAVAPQHGQDADALLRCADVARDQAKQSVTRVAVYSRAGDQHRPDGLALLGDLRLAIERDELLLHYQPKLAMRDGTLVGLEALVRWPHPQRGFLPPSEFVSLAESSWLIHPLSVWVLESVMRQQRTWRAAGMDLPVAVNLSRRMLHDPRLPDTIADLLTRWDVPAVALSLEITESSLMVDPLRAAENLKQLRALGVRMSIDDFGTGYSSLGSLKNLSVDELKIDQSFVRGMAGDASARAIVRAIIDLADALQLQVVAEGVEDRATWDVLAGLGCDVAQGYFLSPPLGAAELEAWIVHLAPAWVEIAARPQAEDPLPERIRGRGARLTTEDEFIARKQLEADLYASEERNRLALQAAGMGTWDLDLVRNVHTWSPETEALFGLAPGTINGSLTAYQGAVHPDDWGALTSAWQAALAERRDFTAIYRTLWPDGSVHWIEDTGRGLYTADGAPTRMSGTSMDITKRRQAEEAVRASEERFRRQYKSFPLPTYSWVQDGDEFRLQDFNDAAAAVAPSVLDGVGTSISELFGNRPEIVADLKSCVAEQKTLTREMRYRYYHTGLERDLVVTYVFVPPLTVMAHIEDITDAKQAEQQREAMAQSEKLRALGQMASGIAHDLNQSLMLVASYSDLARQALLGDPPNLVELEDLLTTTNQAAMDGGETVKRLLLFTRAAPEHDSQTTGLSSVVRAAAQLTSPRWRDATQAEGRPISLHIEADGNPAIQGSPAQLRELMTNLIFNAVDALPRGGTIRLRVMVENGRGIIEVADSGVGMSAEVQARIFEPFFTTKGESGTGLGLAMVFGIVEQHGGNIEVRSAPGDGTTFRISFPLLDPSVATGPHPKDPGRLEPPLALRVLVVDDEPMMTRAVARMLKPAGHIVSMAGSGEEALEKLAGQTFDVVVSDMGMGAGMNGWELADAVKGRWPEVRFLLATGWGAAIDPGEARTRGVEAVLAKPYHAVDIMDALAKAP